MTYRLGKRWFGMRGDVGQSVLEYHTGEWLHPALSIWYVLLTGLGLLALIGTGACMLWKSRSRQTTRRLHRWAGLVLLVPLAATAISGILYKMGQEWFAFPEETSSLLMVIHEGRWVGKTLHPWYVLLLGAGLLWLAGSGLWLLLPHRRKARPTV